MRKPPNISCIVPAYNAEKYLRETLNSILSQRDVLREVIVVDDGSTDGTAAIVESYGEQIRLLRQENAGLAAARNRGIEHSQGEFVTFMDADDLYPPDRFGLQLRAFEDDPQLELCAGHVQNFEGDLRFLGEPVPGYNTDVLVRRTLFAKIGLFPIALRHASKLEWMLRVRRAKVAERLLLETLIYRRMHGENMSLTQSNHSLREHLLTLHASLKNRG